MWEDKDHQRLDKLRFDFTINVTEEYKNVSKHKRILAPVVHWNVVVYANNRKINQDEEEVFVIDEFFNSLAKQGEVPMYTCSCGNFECGGFYINVMYKKDIVIWKTEQRPVQKFTFSKINVLLFAEKLMKELKKLNNVLLENGLTPYFEIDEFKSKVQSYATYNHL
ncbi:MULTISPECIES: hypothetical protein [Paenibacillus]|uniref:Uncharacterized protein n=1 Tax=Paenibacillus illinoisensis TaxID=59845 RepID=A0A2W0CAV7_9BACL|nr:hypothetical protein [Paenibacillus illinoisensis]PYY29726.1 Uncharacterized protein PIL02S_01926 [Paenibacillus illinoisensis]